MTTKRKKVAVPAGEERLWTTREVAALLCTTKRTLARWCEIEGIPYRRMPNGELRFIPDEIREFMKMKPAPKNKVEAKPEEPPKKPLDES